MADLQQRLEPRREAGPSATTTTEADPVQRMASSASAAAQRRAAVQFAGGGGGDVHGAAQKGVAGAGGPLPHGAAIQRSFGHHGLGDVKAHVGGQAAEASKAMGARAYATGRDVAFAEQPDLHTAAHEAAHVVQQRKGVQLKGGVGAAGDAYERHADAVADAVVAGRSAQGLLDSGPGGGGGGSAVQRQDETAGGSPAGVSTGKSGGQSQSSGPASDVEGAPNMSTPEEDGGMTPADPLEAFLQALEQQDAQLAWDAYTTLPPPDHSQLSQADLQAAMGLFYPVHGLASIQLIFDDHGIAAPMQMTMADGAGILDAELAYLLTNTPGVTAAEQVEIASDSSLMALIVGLVGADRMPHQFFEILAADAQAFVDACSTDNPLSQWVDSDDATLKAVTDSIGDYTMWSKAFMANNAWESMLRMAALDADPNANWRAGVIAGSGYGWVVAGAAKPIGDDLVPGLWALYGDGSSIDIGDKYKTWDCLYNAELVTSSTDLQTWKSNPWQADGWTHTRTKFYHGVAPDSGAMDQFFVQYKQIPRVQIDLASRVMMCDYRFYKHEKDKPAETFFGFELEPAQHELIWEDEDKNPHPNRAAVAAAKPMGTSYYNSTTNTVLMRATGAGGGASTSMVPDVGTGTGRSGSAVNDQYDEHGNRTGGLTYFQNHATHEIGHAVGNKRLVKDGIDGTGNAAAETYANWQRNGNATTYARQLDWTAAMDTTNYSLTHNGNTHDVSGRDIRIWLVAKVGGTAAAATNGLKVHFNGNEDAAIQSDATLAGHTLVRTVNSVRSKGSAFRFPHGIPSAGAAVHVFSTRWNDGWATYNKSAWDERVSHYAMSSPAEMFAEVYTAHYTGGSIPGGMQPFFSALDTAQPEHFPDHNAAGGGAGADENAGAQAAAEPADSPWPG